MSDDDASWDPTEDDTDETQQVTRLLRWIGVFFIVPGISIGLAFILFEDPTDHVGHITLSLGFGVLGILMALLSRRIAVRYT